MHERQYILLFRVVGVVGEVGGGGGQWIGILMPKQCAWISLVLFLIPCRTDHYKKVNCVHCNVCTFYF